jgi:hypothetical protein
MPDAVIMLDRPGWALRSERRRLALLHHEISHIKIYEGERDKIDRPDIRIRNADYEGDGFHELIDLYGADSVEVEGMHAVARQHAGIQVLVRAEEEATA